MNPVKVLLVEDSVEDRTLILEVLQDERIALDLNFVDDGEQAMAYLKQQPPYENVVTPDLVLLDLNLPKKDGRQVLAEIKSDPDLQSISVVVLTTSDSEEDIVKSYISHANGYVVKPINLDRFVKLVKSINGFWLSAVTYPNKP